MINAVFCVKVTTLTAKIRQALIKYLPLPAAALLRRNHINPMPGGIGDNIV